jgi:hypothetical protein
MLFAVLSLSSRSWLLPVAAFVLLALGVLVWSYRAAPRGWVRWACLALKTLGLAALGFCLLEPLWSAQRAQPGANLFAVVADNSQGLQIRDAGAAGSRGDGLRELLDPGKSSWPGTLAAFCRRASKR